MAKRARQGYRRHCAAAVQMNANVFVMLIDLVEPRLDRRPHRGKSAIASSLAALASSRQTAKTET